MHAKELGLFETSNHRHKKHGTAGMVRPNKNREDPALARASSRMSKPRVTWPGWEEHGKRQELGQTFCAPVLPVQAEGNYANLEYTEEIQTVPESISIAIPNLEDHLRKEKGIAPTPNNWAFYQDVDPGYFTSTEWGEAQQRLFNVFWVPLCEDICNRLIDLHEYMWCWHVPREFGALIPEVENGIKNNSILVGTGMEQVLMYGAYRNMRVKRTWPSPQPIVCSICSRTFPPESLSPWMLRYFGPRRYCPECCCRAFNGNSSKDLINAKGALQGFANTAGMVPMQNFRREINIGAISEQDRDLIVAWMILVPEASVCKEIFNGPWLKVLQDSGLADDLRRAGMGYQCMAKDGHFCRSLGERSIDDYLFNNGISHKIEPTWPKHAKLNPTGRLRADWLLSDGTYVEYAGMMSNADYASNMQKKIALARELDINLIVIVPEDLPYLSAIFRSG